MANSIIPTLVFLVLVVFAAVLLATAWKVLLDEWLKTPKQPRTIITVFIMAGIGVFLLVQAGNIFTRHIYPFF